MTIQVAARKFIYNATGGDEGKAWEAISTLINEEARLIGLEGPPIFAAEAKC